MHDSVNTAGAVSSQDTASEAGLIYRLESIPFSRWHSKARILIGSATFFDASDDFRSSFEKIRGEGSFGDLHYGSCGYFNKPQVRRFD